MTTTWIKDDRGNKCSIEYYGTEKVARKALDSLKDCDDCTNCSDCSDCSDCSGCSGCSRCSDCSDCSDCSRCSGCSRCSRCSRCSDCSDCSGCSGCSRCSDCSHVAQLSYKRDLQADLDATSVGPPPVPTIPDIHQTVLAAASQPKSLDMCTWHTCENTHCWAGWVVTLAGNAGKRLEAFFDTPLAAMKILDASSSIRVSPVRFFETNDEALRHMRELAEQEAAGADRS